MKITKIPASRNVSTSRPLTEIRKRKVAAYARVSTDHEEQASSYEAQVSYYTQYITSKPEWDFVRVYTDEGISGTGIKKREGFQNMVQDALEGKIDLILTKSVSRFARNTVDSLTTVRLLKENGVEIYFEKENIWTFDSKGELLITIMSSLAQEESRSISENTKWGKRKAFADGKVYMSYKTFLGYRKGIDGKPEIVEKEAKIVRFIYTEYIKGYCTTDIAHKLDAKGIPTKTGKDHWCPSTIKHILTNEKYMGDALLQKTYTEDFLTKKQKHNNGEVPQYYVSGSHPAIVTEAEFAKVQELMARNQKRHSRVNCFSGMVFCAECGGLYGSKVWNSNNKYRKLIWQCNDKYKTNIPCKSAHVTTDQLKAAFIEAYNTLLKGGFETEDYFELEWYEDKIAECQKKYDAQYDELNAMKMNIQDETIFNDMLNEYRQTEQKLFSMKERANKIKIKEAEQSKLQEILDSHSQPITEFDEDLFVESVKKITVDKDRNIKYFFIGQ